MDIHTLWVDRNHSMELAALDGGAGPAALLAVGRDSELHVTPADATFWVVLRGNAHVECREGRFELLAGDWLSLDRDARPSVVTGQHGLVVGIALGAELQLQLQQAMEGGVFPGRGVLPAKKLRAPFFRAWRAAARFDRNEQRVVDVDRRRLGQVLRMLSVAQHAFRGMVDRCPGRSLRRKRQVFSRMQRAHLYLQGNLERAVRISELAALSNVSVWYFTKTFHALYGEGPQATSTRLRLQHAARLLRRTSLSVSEAGEACGFENNCSFSRAFRGQFGMPPSSYRMRGFGLPADAANLSDMDRQAEARWAS